MAIFTLRLISGACNGVLHPKSSPSANLTIEIRGYIKTTDSKLPTPTLEIRGYIKTADSKLPTPTLEIRGDSKLLTPTLEDNVKLPTTAPVGWVSIPTHIGFRL